MTSSGLFWGHNARFRYIMTTVLTFRQVHVCHSSQIRSRIIIFYILCFCISIILSFFAMHYAPHVDLAFLSAKHTMRDIEDGCHCGHMAARVVHEHEK